MVCSDMDDKDAESDDIAEDTSIQSADNDTKEQAMQFIEHSCTL